MRYLLNIQQGKIHNADKPCAPVARMSEANKKAFDRIEDAINYYEGNRRKGTLCTRCFPSKKQG